MKPSVSKTKLFGESLYQQQVSSFTLTERFYPPHFRTPRHAHENALFCLVLKGSYTETYGTKSIDCLPSTMLFHAGGFPHAEDYHQSGGHSLIIEVNQHWLSGIRQQVGFPSSSVDFRSDSISYIGSRLYREFRTADTMSPLVIEGLMLELAGETARSVSTSTDTVPLWLKRVEEVLRERFRENVSLDEIAAFAGVHPVYLAQSFRKHRRTTVGNYLRELRLESARNDLQKSKRSLSTIAFDNGFSDQSHFSRLFKLRFGVSPNQFRRLL